MYRGTLHAHGVEDNPGIAGRIRHRPAGHAIRPPAAGPVVSDQPDTELADNPHSQFAPQPGLGCAVETEYRYAVTGSVLGEHE